ncbi:MAG: DUF493 domain-containing protein [Flavobacteriales bacterium]|nr:DUF493 domain-containing protein [Flavobacteriales bacterium]
MTKINFTSLREKLEEDSNWPRVYFFKFIVPSDNEKLAKVEALFGPETQVNLKQSSKGNFISVSAKELMLSANRVIDRYEKAAEIEGLMAL